MHKKWVEIRFTYSQLVKNGALFSGHIREKKSYYGSEITHNVIRVYMVYYQNK